MEIVIEIETILNQAKLAQVLYAGFISVEQIQNLPELPTNWVNEPSHIWWPFTENYNTSE